MPPRRCPFCTHHNPARSRFCNECGSPLHLKPCPQCAAVSDETARRCHQCGTEFAPIEAEAEPAVETTQEIQATASSSAHSSTSSDDANVSVLSEPPAAVNADEHAHVYVPESFAASLSTHREQIGEVLLTANPDRTPRPPPFAIESFATMRRDYAYDRRVNTALVLLLAFAIGAIAYLTHRPAPALDAWLAAVQFDMLGVVRAAAPVDGSRPVQDAERAAQAPTNAIAPMEPAPSPVPTSAASSVSVPSEAPATQPHRDTPAPQPASADAGTASETAAAPPAEQRAATSSDAKGNAAVEPRRAETAFAAKRTVPSPRSSPRRSGESSARATDASPAYTAPPAAAPPPPAAAGPCTRAVAALGLCENNEGH